MACLAGRACLLGLGPLGWLGLAWLAWACEAGLACFAWLGLLCWLKLALARLDLLGWALGLLRWAGLASMVWALACSFF